VSRVMTADMSGGGALARNIMHFSRALRAAGLPVGPGKTLEAVEAAARVGLAPREDFYWALHAVFVERAAERQVFDQAFRLFWRNPEELRRMMAPAPESEHAKPETEKISRRVADALTPDDDTPPREEEDVTVELDASLTYSAMEVLQDTDFDSMTAEEVEEAKRMIAEMRLPIMEVATRRFAPDARGSRVDMRASLRAGLRSSGALMPLRYRKRVTRHPPLVVLCDISGSMSRYSRMFLHFVHAVTNDRDRVHCFIFGTRLTNITRHLQYRDVDIALDRVAKAAMDWSGGTRIGASLEDFNRFWSRRVLGQGAVVLLITDGLDRGDVDGLDREIERLHKSCRRLIWLNPLLRFEGFRPEARGVKAILPHVDDFRTVHSLNSLRDIAKALSRVQRADQVFGDAA
jgi:uncharacterized protein with von Willebrand factor type A (vWA) domain